MELGVMLDKECSGNKGWTCVRNCVAMRAPVQHLSRGTAQEESIQASDLVHASTSAVLAASASQLDTISGIIGCTSHVMGV
jgi:hypothetical protein